MLRHAVTLTFDPVTLNVCCRSYVTQDSVSTLSKIEQSAAELLNILVNFRTFSAPPCKITGEVDEMSESLIQAQEGFSL